MAAPENPQFHVALVGASTLRGKEVKGLLEARGFPVGRLALLDAEEARGQLTEFDDEPVIIQPIGMDSFENMSFAIFASSQAFTEQHWRLAEECGCEVIDLSYCLETNPRARLRSPLVESLWKGNHGQRGPKESESRLSVSAHPAAIAIAGVLGQITGRCAVTRSAVTVLEPVSERGKAGVEELSRQTVSLLSFQEMPRQVFDSQVAFNLLSDCGEHCQPSLREIQERIGNHARRLLAGRTLPPAIRLLQAPVFYGHAFSCFVELAEPVPTKEIEDALNRKPFQVTGDPEDQPTVVGVAGSDEIVLGAVERDPACEAGYWIWGVMDNVRLAALNAVEIAEEKIFAGNCRAS